MKILKGFSKAAVCLLAACILCVGALSVPAMAARPKVIPGGMNFGVKLFTEGLLVIGTAEINTVNGEKSPAYDSGIRQKDVILKVNGEDMKSSEQLKKTVSESGGKVLEIELKTQEGQSKTVKVTPVLNTQTKSYSIGVWVRDSTAGIGTVTYIDAETLRFGGLGHGISDMDTGALMPIGKAYVVDVNITSVKKGDGRTPGELKGTFDKEIKGELYSNTDCGVFGAFETLPRIQAKAVEVAYKDEITEGDAYILCQMDGKVEKYRISIEKIYKDSGKTKNFLIKVTDDKLIEKTGGIVQGMSGSPIIQKGKLVGAVTHVLVSDHTKGYGIFIENMMEAAE